jgi:hypothetical protein
MNSKGNWRNKRMEEWNAGSMGFKTRYPDFATFQYFRFSQHSIIPIFQYSDGLPQRMGGLP